MEIPGLFDKFVENVYKFVSNHWIVIFVAHDAVHYVYDRYCKFQLNMFTCTCICHLETIHHAAFHSFSLFDFINKIKTETRNKNRVVISEIYCDILFTQCIRLFTNT